MAEFKVLIVDDSPFMRKVFSDVIDVDAAFNVLATACDGEEAVNLTLELKPDIITMDLEMPRMNGLEALQKIMAVKPTPIIMLSAVTDNGTRDTIRALQYGAIDFIRKPDGAVKLDIRQVGEQLLEKLRIVAETIHHGPMRLLPAVEEKPAEILPTPVTSDRGPSPVAKKAAKTSADAVTAPTVKEARKPVKTPVEPQVIANLPKLPRRETEARKGEQASGAAKPRSGKLNEQSPSVKSFRQAIRLANAADKAPSFAAKKEAKPPVRIENQVRATPPTAVPKPTGTFSHIVAIGTSTGGPRALHEVLTGIPADFPAPILVVQHMPPKFTHSLAQRLDTFCNIHVREATDGEPVETATAYIAPGGKHMSLAKDASGKYRIKLTNEGPRSGHMPSVDVLFDSLVGHRQLIRHAVLMTGMGSDGAKGMKALREDGAQTTIAESEQTCVVYGMPRSAVEIGAATHQLPLQGIAPVLVQETKSRKT